MKISKKYELANPIKVINNLYLDAATVSHPAPGFHSASSESAVSACSSCPSCSTATNGIVNSGRNSAIDVTSLINPTTATATTAAATTTTKHFTQNAGAAAGNISPPKLINAVIFKMDE